MIGKNFLEGENISGCGLGGLDEPPVASITPHGQSSI